MVAQQLRCTGSHRSQPLRRIQLQQAQLARRAAARRPARACPIRVSFVVEIWVSGFPSSHYNAQLLSACTTAYAVHRPPLSLPHLVRLRG